ncbi:MAG: GHKL domain-containing protein [Bacteroidales bacterium]|jgi:signal transduction histidine kinase|nr:GHKL domain-containing protein [Bacteroidales bacterium]
MKAKKNRILWLFISLLALSIAAGITINIIKWHNAKLSAQSVIADVALGRDKKAEQLMIAAEDYIIRKKIDAQISFRSTDSTLKDSIRSILRPVRRQYYTEISLYDSQDSIYVANIAEPQNALSYFRSRLGSRRIDSSYHIYNVSENITKRYVCLIQIKDSIIFIEIESRRASPHSAYSDISLNETRKETYYDNDLDISFAKYTNGNLIFQSGSFPYPKQAVIPNKKWQETIHHYCHYSIQNTISSASNKPLTEQWVITIHKNLIYDSIISASYIFLATLLVMCLVFVGIKLYKREPFGLNTKVFFTLIALLLVIFIVLGLITVRNLADVNTNANTDTLKEKTLSINIELSNFFSYNDSTESLSDYVMWLSAAFFVDINVYNAQGIIMASNRENMFHDNILPKSMNSNAFAQLKGLGSRYVSPIFVQTERFRSRKFLSSYMPIVNQNNVVVGYVNIPFLSGQREMEAKIDNVISNYAGIYLLFVNISILLAALISRILTNIKKNERDKAWKELARQVSHEVKNPLTPMKLSIQHLQRLKNDGEKKFDQLFDEVSTSLIEQIDTLSDIATEFSDYSKIDNARLTNVNLVSCLQTAVSTFSNLPSTTLTFNSHGNNEVIVLADKALLIRVFNNIIKNAVQATSNSPLGKIDVDLQVIKQRAVVTISDNGCGISKVNQAKIFQYSFTTKNDGSGLGLLIVHDAIASFKGTISFTSNTSSSSSEQASGTYFTITLPVKGV